MRYFGKYSEDLVILRVPASNQATRGLIFGVLGVNWCSLGGQLVFTWGSLRDLGGGAGGSKGGPGGITCSPFPVLFAPESIVTHQIWCQTLHDSRTG